MAQGKNNSNCLEPWQEWTISKKNCRILIRETNTKSDHAWIILHDKGLHQEYLYKAFAPSQNEVHLIFPGMLAIGRSPCRGNELPPPDLGQDVIKTIIKSTKSEKLTLVGHGLSSLTALKYIKSNKNSIDRLILIDPPPLKGSREKLKDRIGQLKICDFYKKVHDFDPELKEEYTQLSSALFYNPTFFDHFKSWAGIYPPLFKQGVNRLPKKWDYQTIAKENAIIIEPGKTLYANDKNYSELEINTVSESGHFIWLEQPYQWAKLLEEVKTQEP
jgi:pimeloyl-ACP methyl ester carboxylesterase